VCSGGAEPESVDLLVPGFTTPYNSSETETSDHGDNDDGLSEDEEEENEEEEEDDDDDDDDDDELADDGDTPACELTAASDSSVAKKKTCRMSSVIRCIRNYKTGSAAL